MPALALALALGATATTSPNDDAMVLKIREFMAGPLADKIIQIIADLVGQQLGTVKAQNAAEQAAAKATVEAAAIPWTLILAIAKIIFDLISSFTKPTE